MWDEDMIHQVLHDAIELHMPRTDVANKHGMSVFDVYRIVQLFAETYMREGKIRPKGTPTEMRVLDLYLNGATVDEIYRNDGIPRDRILAVLDEFGVRVPENRAGRPHAVGHEKRYEIARDFVEHKLPATDVARKYNVSPSSVYRYAYEFYGCMWHRERE